MKKNVNWDNALKPLLKKYKGKKHPLEYKNIYQLMIMVILSAQSTDNLINKIAPEFFKAYPNLKSLMTAKAEDLYPLISKVRGFNKKAAWIVKIAQQLKADKNIPLSMEGLTALPGIGRKSANVIMREAGMPAEGIVVDLHVVRVAPRIGITTSDDPKKIEQELMEAMPKETWGEIGMAISFLGREVCRPTDPKHDECPITDVCEYFKQTHKIK